MTRQQLGQNDEARTRYDKGVEWMDKNAPQNEELLRFRVEAAELLGRTVWSHNRPEKRTIKALLCRWHF